MDRYHLSWLMVGKPKDIVRGRPMTPDEEAAYVREVAEEKTAALRMSLDAVERQGMPFVGEERGMAPGQGMGTTPREQRHVTDATTTEGTTLAVGGARRVPAPDPIARDYILLALRLDQHIPGLVDGYFGPADLKAQVDIEQLRAPGPARATTRRRSSDGSPAEVAEPDRRDWLAAQLVALGTQAAALAGDDAAVPRPRRRAASPGRRCDATTRFRRGRGRARRAPPGRRSRSPTGSAAWDAALRDPGRSPARRRRLARRRGSARGRRDLFGLPDGEDLRVWLVTNQPWSGYNWYDGGRRSRVDSTRTCRSGRPTSSTRSPTRPTPATTSSTPGRRPTWSIGSAGSRRRSC